MDKQNNTPVDVVIVGGGAAGLNAAQMLGRSRRSVVVVDGGEPRNAPAKGVHGFLSRDGVSPAELYRIGREEAESYGVRIISGQVSGAAGFRGAFAVELADGSAVRGRRLLIATGLVDELPDIPGLRERWGRDVLHCPYCHGWEVQDQPIGILGTGPFAAHQALLFRQWSADITLFLNNAMEPTELELHQLAARGITVVHGPVRALQVDNDKLAGVLLSDGSLVPVAAVATAPRFMARASAFADLGLKAVPHPMGMGEYLETDEDGATGVPGVWAAGNVTDLRAQVLSSAAAGAWTGVVINADLMAEELEDAATAYRGSVTA
ncbi:NAD(P)/FAD-dependent oxidoreductase [Arthrobacter oryzae]|uniref:NAD(P)/FAD-dependent oxidoreductase n=1 Tax=Arthrobacter oryzae TaxID=409290 RepID=UPI00273C2A95|nr:NAD(P)/FAD-dependent oxidoreductase [Arthrobacter oryzae]WLQ08494.1 NAD(P)/FAD-dependent oxidoreductase [Arthrobacter oryzae]